MLSPNCPSQPSLEWAWSSLVSKKVFHLHHSNLIWLQAIAPLLWFLPKEKFLPKVCIIVDCCGYWAKLSQTLTSETNVDIFLQILPGFFTIHHICIKCWGWHQTNPWVCCKGTLDFYSILKGFLKTKREEGTIISLTSNYNLLQFNHNSN